MGGRGASSGVTRNYSTSKLPELKGSEKQIKWANQIRSDAIEVLDRNIKLASNRLKETKMKNVFELQIEAYKQTRENVYNALMKIDRAEQLIDKRHIFSSYTILREADKLKEVINRKR